MIKDEKKRTQQQRHNEFLGARKEIQNTIYLREQTDNRKLLYWRINIRKDIKEHEERD